MGLWNAYMAIPSNWYESDYPKVLVAIIDYYTTGLNKLYCSTHELVATLGGNLTGFNPRLVGDVSFSIGLVDSAKGSRTTSNYGKLRFLNSDGKLDLWLDYGFDGRNLKLLVAPIGVTNLDTHSVEVFNGKIDKLEIEDNNYLSLSFRDPLLLLDTPIQPTNYSVGETITYFDGTTNVTVTVTDNLKDKTKPMVYGKVYNIEPVLISSADRVYQVDSMPIHAITAVYDKGVLLTPGVGYVVDTSKGVFELIHNNAGTITCDVEGRILYSTSYSARLSEIVKDILINKGIPISVLDEVVNRSVDVGIYISDRENTLDVLDKLVSSVDGFYGFKPNGMFILGNLTVPNTSVPSHIAGNNFSKYGDLFSDRAGNLYVLGSDLVAPIDYASVETLSESGIITPVDRITKLTESDIIGNYTLTTVGDVVYRAKVRHSKNYTVQTDVAYSVSGAVKEFMSKEYRDVVSEDLAIQTKHTRAIEYIQEESYLVDSTFGAILANRFLQKNKMPVLELRMTVQSYSMADVTLGSILNIFDYRFGFSSGVLACVREISVNYLANTAEVVAICTRVPNQSGTFTYNTPTSIPAGTTTDIPAFYNSGRVFLELDEIFGLYNYVDISIHEAPIPNVGDPIIRYRKVLGGVNHITIPGQAEQAVSDSFRVGILLDIDARQVGVYHNGTLLGTFNLPDSVLSGNIHSYLYISVANNTTSSFSMYYDATEFPLPNTRNFGVLETKRRFSYL